MIWNFGFQKLLKVLTECRDNLIVVSAKLFHL